jgi:hypothetical protein
MNVTAEQIERVVREVLAEMVRAPAGPQPSPPPLPASKGKPSTADRDGMLVLNSQLVTLAEVAERLPGKRRVVVRPGAVVTPAVRDALRQRNVALEFAAAAVQGDLAPLRLVLIAVLTRLDVQLLATALRGEGLEVESRHEDCILAATDQLAGELTKGETLGVLLTPHTAAALCLANRRPGVRAILSGELRSLPGDAEAVGANALIVDPKKAGAHQVRLMIESFCAGGVRSCPAAFVERLS